MNQYYLALWMTFIAMKKLQLHISSSRNPEKRMGKKKVWFMKHIYVNGVLLWLRVWYKVCAVCIKVTRRKEVWNKVISLLRFFIIWAISHTTECSNDSFWTSFGKSKWNATTSLSSSFLEYPKSMFNLDGKKPCMIQKRWGKWEKQLRHR